MLRVSFPEAPSPAASSLVLPPPPRLKLLRKLVSAEGIWWDAGPSGDAGPGSDAGQGNARAWAATRDAQCPLSAWVRHFHLILVHSSSQCPQVLVLVAWVDLVFLVHLVFLAHLVFLVASGFLQVGNSPCPQHS